MYLTFWLLIIIINNNNFMWIERLFKIKIQNTCSIIQKNRLFSVGGPAAYTNTIGLRRTSIAEKPLFKLRSVCRSIWTGCIILYNQPTSRCWCDSVIVIIIIWYPVTIYLISAPYNLLRRRRHGSPTLRPCRWGFSVYIHTSQHRYLLDTSL